MRILISILFLMLCLSLTLSARKEYKISKRLVRISQKDSKRVRTGFLINYKGKIAVVCTKEAFLPKVDIIDKQGKELKFSEILVPTQKEKSNILILILSDQNNPPQSLTMNSNPEQTIKPGNGIDVQGYSRAKQKLYSGKGKVTEIGVRQIKISSKVRADISGAPVIASKNKELIGIAFCRKRGRKIEMAYAERIDNIANFAKVSTAELAREESDLKTLSSAVISYSQTFRKVRKIIEEMHYTDDNLKRLKKYYKNLHEKKKKELKEEIKELYEKLKDITKELKKQLKNADKRKNMIIPSFANLFRANKLRAKEIVDRKCKPNEEMLEKILDAISSVF